MPRPDGPAPPPTAQTTTVELPKMFFVMGPHCRSECDAVAATTRWCSRSSADAASFARGARRQWTSPSRPQGRPVAKTSRVIEANRDTSTAHSVEDAGLRPSTAGADVGASSRCRVHRDRRPDARLSVARHSSRTGTSPRSRASATATASGKPSGGTRLPFYARNLQTVTEYVQRLSLTDLMPRVRAARGRRLRVAAARPRHAPAADRHARRGAVARPGTEVAPFAQGTGLFWAAMERGDALPRTKIVERTRSTVIQATNLGITVKDSPHSTLVFVTRLDNGQPVPGARVHDRQHRQQTAVAGDDRRDRDSRWRRRCRCASRTIRYRFSFLVTAEKDGDVAYVGSDWNEGIQAVGLRSSVPAVGSDRHPARLGVHRPRRLQARRAGPGQSDRPRRHAERHPAAAGGDQSRRGPARQPRPRSRIGGR